MLLGLFLAFISFANAYTKDQIITPEPSSISVAPGSEFTFSVKYDVSDGNNMLTGIGIRVHYDSSILEFVEVSNVFDENHLAGAIYCEDDTEDWDDDDNTDKFVLACWFDLGGNWPGEELPLTLFDITFKLKEPVNTSINFTASDTASGSGYGFESQPLNIISGQSQLIYANSYTYTPSGQPPRYWEVGVTTKPPPRGVHPEYALDRPDGLLTGWAPEKGEIILGFPSPLKNVDGDDLIIWHFGKPEVADVYISTQSKDPSDWQLLGTLSESPFDNVKKETFDFGTLDDVYYVKIEKFAGGYHTGHFIDAVAGYALGIATPEVDIKANGQDGPITLNQSDTLTITVSLDNNGITDNADFWLAADTPFGLYFFTFDGWTDAWVPGYQGQLCYLDPYEVIADMPISGLPAGPYTIYFGVDTVMDGNVTWDKAVYDTVEVNITSE